MSAMKITTTVLSLLTLSLATEAPSQPFIVGAQHSSHFTTYEIVLGYRPMDNSSRVVYGSCNNYHGKRNLECSIYLVSQLVAGDKIEFHEQRCKVKHQAEDGKVIGEDLELGFLSDDRVLSTWLEVGGKESNAVLRVTNMRDCEFEETRIPSYGVGLPLRVAYNNTFDVFFRNASACGGMMCGQTHDTRAQLINGPVASYLPAEFFRENTYVCPVRPASSALGHFLLSSKLRLVSSSYGRVTELMDYPAGVVSLAFSCDHGFLGFCWIDHLDEMYVNCRQFDSRGVLELSIRIMLEYRGGQWMAMRNLPGGGLLLLTSECNAENWCEQNVDKVSFYAYRVHRDKRVDLLRQIKEVPCTGDGLKTDIQEKLNGTVCITFVCRGKTYAPYTNVHVDLYVKVVSRCIAWKNM
ncbi:uncharacterized protein LOC106640390 [Copidosoma floridanum]|uniref:uncharacterized protein LOC106640390 n=1 Tax=Copidosoma floridanum TaxID=29053 RepID=UPI0006C961B0|nr:uncharacterized protein LOC106640390 [Copidosoma floridanum]